jgi:transposase
MIRSKNHIFDYRLKLVTYAKSHGKKKAARTFRCSINTVIKWCRRFEQNGLSGLVDLSRAPHSCPHKLPKEAVDIILSYRKKTPSFGARHLKYEFDLPWGVNSIARVIRQHATTRKRKHKHRVKNDLRAVKAAFKPFTHIQLDVKYLYDIPHYWPQMKLLNLPKYQYTARELSVGAQFLAYGNELSVTYATITAHRLLQHLEKHGVDLREVKAQTDNGSEFNGQTEQEKDFGFTYTVEKLLSASHLRIPPGCKNAQADVETVHNLIEDEFFDIESFRNRKDFFSKVNTYQNFFNLARKNGSRNYKSPLELLTEKAPSLNPEILCLPVLDLDLALSSLPVHHVPSLVEKCVKNR